jgi:enoyl-CoA hydratase/carnithine racemase
MGWTTVSVTDVEPHISVLAMNRPAQRNAIDVTMAGELEASLARLNDKRDLRVLIVTGEGTAFGAGADLKERTLLSVGQTQSARAAVLRFTEMLEAFRAPVIAMINGPAIAGSFEIALACDFRVASDQATFALPEVRRVGAFPGAGGPVRLSRLVGRGRASYTVLTGRTLSAAEAFALDMVEVVVPHERLLNETLFLARQIAANSPEGVSAAKQLILKSNDLDLQSAMRLSRALRDPLDATAAARAAIQAWTEHNSQ